MRDEHGRVINSHPIPKIKKITKQHTVELLAPPIHLCMPIIDWTEIVPINLFSAPL